MPPSLAWWASTLQLSGLSPSTADLARQFLSRAPQLDPRVRDQMAYRITADVVAQISPPPPPGTPPQYVLAAVLAERHRRELVRLGAHHAPPGPPHPQAPQFAPVPATYAAAPPYAPAPPTYAPQHRRIHSPELSPRAISTAAAIPAAARTWFHAVQVEK